MFKRQSSVSLVVLGLFALIVSGCSSSSNNPSPLSAFEPEIINNADAFQFQATGLTNVSATVSYTWANTGARATINHSSVVNNGTANVSIADADGTQVYTSSLLASATEQSTTGTPGDWTVTVVLLNASGTLNFSAEKL